MCQQKPVMPVPEVKGSPPSYGPNSVFWPTFTLPRQAAGTQPLSWGLAYNRTKSTLRQLPQEAGTVPARALLDRSSHFSAAIRDQDPGSGPLSLLSYNQHALSLVKAAQEGGKVPAKEHTAAGCVECTTQPGWDGTMLQRTMHRKRQVQLCSTSHQV